MDMLQVPLTFRQLLFPIIDEWHHITWYSKIRAIVASTFLMEGEKKGRTGTASRHWGVSNAYAYAPKVSREIGKFLFSARCGALALGPVFFFHGLVSTALSDLTLLPFA